MKEFTTGLAIGLAFGVFAGGALSYFYASLVIGEYKRTAGKVGVFFNRVEGKLQAIRKDL